MFQPFKKKYKSIETDDFLLRLRCSVIGEGMLHEGNIYLIDKAIKDMPKDGYVLEIGVYAGLSTNLILHLLEKYKKPHKMVGCDAWIYEGFYDSKGMKHIFVDGKENVKRESYITYIKNAYINASKLFHTDRLPYTCHLTSDEFFKIWNNGNDLSDVFNRVYSLDKKIAFCYLDGDHSYKQTKADFENINNHLLIGGYVLIDDSAKHLNFGSSRFIKDLKKRNDFEIVDYNPNFLVKKIK